MAVTTVRYDSPSARRHQRVVAPARVELGGERYSTRDWSVGGFRIAGYSGDARVDERRPIRFCLNFQGFEIGFEAEARICGVNPERQELSAEFDALGQRERELLRHFVVGVATGEMSSVSDTLVHMDTPTSVANWGRAPLASEDVLAGGPWKKPNLLRASLYFVAGPLVAGYAILAAYQAIFRMELETAVVVRPTETVVAQGVGHVEKLLVHEGQLVTAGEPLLTAVDEDHGRDLETRRLELARARVELKAASAATAAARDNLAIYVGIALHKQKVASARVKSLTIQTESAEKELARVESIVQAGLEPSSALDAAKASYAKVKGDLSEALPELDLANDAVLASQQGSFYDGFRLIGDLPEGLIREDAARARVQIAQQQLDAAEKGSGNATYSAPFPGRVVRITKSPGSTVDRGETLALIERVDDAPRIYALATPDQISRIQLGATGTVRVPTLQRRFQAVVVVSDRSGASSGGGLGDLLANAARPRTSDLTGLIELDLRPLTPEARNLLRSGMPAIVNLPRQDKQTPWRGPWSWLPS